MSDNNDTGEVSEELKKKLIAIQDATAPLELGTPVEKHVADIEKYAFPQFQMILDGAVVSLDDILELARNGQLKNHKSSRTEMQFFSAGDTVIVHGLANGFDYLGDGTHTENINVPFCDVFVCSDGRWRIIATTASPPRPVVTDAVEKAIIAIQESMLYLPDRTSEELAENVKKYSLPEADFILNGVIISRDDLIKGILGSKPEISKIRIHDRKFTIKNGTLFVFALCDHTEIKESQETIVKDVILCDTFVLVDAQWFLLASTVNSPLPSA